MSYIKHLSITHKIGFCRQYFSQIENRLLSNQHIKFNIVKNVSTSSTSSLFFEPDRKGGYSEEEKKKTVKEKFEDMKSGFRMLKKECALFQQEMKEDWESDFLLVRPGDMDKVWEFKTEKDLERWKVANDGDFKDGFSSCRLQSSPNGHGLFQGNLDNTVPKDGKNKYAGYCNITSVQLRKSFQRRDVYDWEDYTHLEMRIRGDGRSYMIVINVPGYFDITWFDTYAFPLYTRGGPYWQTSRIPFSKFFWTTKGRVQDKQYPLHLNRVSSLGITAADDINGPFNLEIDYIGLYCHPTHKEEFAYELYKQPSKFYLDT